MLFTYGYIQYFNLLKNYINGEVNTYRKQATGNADRCPGSNPISQNSSFSFREEHRMTWGSAVMKILQLNNNSGN